MVKIRQNASGVVTGLTIDTGIINRSCLPASRMAVLFARGNEGSTKSQLRIVSLMTLRLAPVPAVKPY